MMQKRLEVLSTRVQSSLCRQIEQLSQERELSIAQLLRIAVRDYLAHNKPKASPIP